MLETLRQASKGWFAAILILVLVGSFGIWGIQDWVNTSSNPKIATVGGQEISPQDFQNEFQRYVARIAQREKTEISTADAKARGLDKEALDEMTTRFALLAKAKSAGLAVTNAQVVDLLKRDLPDGSGGVNRAALDQILQQNQVSEAQFYELLKADILRNQFLRTITVGITMPPGLNEALQRYRQQRMVADYVLIDPSRAGEIKDPDEAALKAYYDAHADRRYSTPEYRAVTLVTLGPAEVASRVNITDDEIKKAYERAKSYFETPEKRKIEQIRFKTEAAARAAKAKLDGGTSFEDVAKAEGYKPEDIKLGDVSKSDTTIPADAFALPVNKVSEPLKGAFGWVILRVLAITPGTSKPYEEAAKEIRAEFMKGRAKEEIINLTADFEDALGGGQTLEEAAKKFNLPVKAIPSLSVLGVDAAGAKVEGLPGAEFIGKAFIADTGADSEANETVDGVRYFFRVDKVTAAARKPLAQVRDEVLANWRAEEQRKRLSAIADELVKKGNTGTTMASIASSLGVSPLKTEPMERSKPQAVFGPDAMEAAGSAKVGEFFTGSVAGGKGRVVGRLADVSYVEEARDDPTRKQYAAFQRQIFGEDIIELFTKAVKSEVGVEVDQAQFDKFRSGE